jgi:hypothetical protein
MGSTRSSHGRSGESLVGACSAACGDVFSTMCGVSGAPSVGRMPSLCTAAPMAGEWHAHGQQGGSPLRALGMASAAVRLPSGGVGHSASPLAVDWRRFEVCWSSTALKVWFGQSCREAGIAADAGAARAISSIADCCSVVVTVVVVVCSGVVVEISWSATMVFWW